jgi:hypothetical protein
MKGGDPAGFIRLLEQRAIPYCDEEHLERWIPVEEARPDFFARPYGFPPFLAEIAGPWEGAPSPAPAARQRAESLEGRQLNRAMRQAARQLRPYRRLGVAMIVVLPPVREGAPPPGPKDLITLTATIEDRRPYISALLVPLFAPSDTAPDAPERERPLRARILHNPLAAVPLHFGIFGKSGDEHLGRRDGQWVDLQTGLPLAIDDG